MKATSLKDGYLNMVKARLFRARLSSEPPSVQRLLRFTRVVLKLSKNGSRHSEAYKTLIVEDIIVLSQS